MGISANQARLMTLTVRQHDLELRAQQISAQKMITSLESQQLAMDYSKSLNEYSLMKAKDFDSIANEKAEIWQSPNERYLVRNIGYDVVVGVVTSSTTGNKYNSKEDLAATIKGHLSNIVDSGIEHALNLAKTEYDTAVASLSAQEKLLDMELTQLNTEHNAVKTEYDAVKGLVSENTDKSFNVFG